MLAKGSEGGFDCLGEYTEKYKMFSVTITKAVRRLDLKENEIKTISYKLQCIDSTRFMTSS